MTRGLQLIDGQGMIHGTASPLTLLRHLATLTVEGIFHLKDLQPHLADASTARAFKEAAIPLSVSRREDIERLRNTARERFVGVKRGDLRFAICDDWKTPIEATNHKSKSQITNHNSQISRVGV